MKKFILSLFAALFLLASHSNAQLVNCNAGFGYTNLTATNIKFNPINMFDAPMVLHFWNFGDGSPVSNIVSATHNYAVGTYTVQHIISSQVSGINTPYPYPPCRDTFYLQITISTSTSCNLLSNFVVGGFPTTPLVKEFYNTSLGISPTDSIRWSFGDGTSTSEFSPIHTYTAYGNYNVCLRIIKRNPNGVLNTSCANEICTPIIISALTTCQVQAAFNIVPTTGLNPLVQYFANTSTNIVATDSIRWTFGDGTSASTYNASHTYANYGIYNVCLRVIKRNPNGVLLTTCASEYCKLDTIAAPACTVQASFTNATVALPANPLVQSFLNTTVGLTTTDSIRWTFGDPASGALNTASSINATHVFSNYGVYNVCLRIIKRINGVLQINCVSEVCHADTIAAPPPTPCTVQAAFNIVPTTGLNPLVQYFANTSINIVATDSIRWTFGDGTSASTYNASHTYANYGIYNVCLRIIKRSPNGVLLPTCVSEYCRFDTITAPINPCSIQAYFTTNGDTAYAPAVILFTNQSTGLSGITNFLWNFGDGTSATTSNAAHTYTTPGLYTVCLIITSQNTTPGAPPCVREYCKTIRILQATPVCTVAANFNILPVASSPLVKFYNNTSLNATPLDSIRWTFGDGTSSNIYSPTHTYAAAGVYHVCLRVIKRNPAGSLTNCVSEICKYDTISIPNPCNIQAYFSTTVSGTTAPAVVQFTNQSTGILPTDIVTWTFGDGSTGAGANPTHTYANAGTYIACIRIVRQTATGATPCVREYCKTLTIAPPVTYCNILAGFSWVRDSAATANLYHFTNTTAGISSTDSVRWSFGDGTFSNAVNPNHTYAAYGAYQVCVRVQKRNAAGVLMANCVSEKCYTVVVTAPSTINCNNVTLSFNTTTDPLYINRKTFTAVSNSTILNQTWTITRMPITPGSGNIIINQFNPTYAFLDSGYYRVCLKAIFANNCIKEYCNTLHIALPTPTTSACNLMLFPNPASTSVTGTVTLSQPLILYAFIYNAQNMLVAQKTQQGAVGLNNVQVNIASLLVGIYRYRLYYGFQTCVSTFLKQ